MRTIQSVVALLIFLYITSIAQTSYRTTTIVDIQRVSLDSLQRCDQLQNSDQLKWSLQTSKYHYPTHTAIRETVEVVGQVIVPPKVIAFTGSGNTLILRDTAATAGNGQWSNMMCRVGNLADTIGLYNAGFFGLQIGDIIRIRGYVDEFPASQIVSYTQFVPIGGLQIVGLGKPIAKPVSLNLGVFYQGTYPGGSIKWTTGEQYEGAYVEFTNLTISSIVSSTSGTFSMVDAYGNEVAMMDASKWFTLRTYKDPTSTYKTPAVFQKIDTIRGFIMTNSGSETVRGYRIAPLFPGDIIYSGTSNILQGEYSNDANTVLLLHMNETSGSTVSDASSSSNHGATSGTTVVNGRFGSGRRFSSPTDAIDVDRSNLRLSFFTAETWINLDSYSTNPTHFIFSNLHSGVDKGFLLALDKSTKLNYTIMAQPHLFSNHQLQVKTWYHIAITYDGSKMKIYINGIEDASISFNSLSYETTNTYPFKIGNHNLNSWDPQNQFFNGTIDEVRISNKVRMPKEFNLQLPPTNLVASATGTIINLAWEAGGGIIGVSKFKIYRGLDSTNVSAIDSTSSTYYQNSSLSAARYYYRISAIDQTGFEGAKSYAISVTIPSTPNAPSLIFPENGKGKITLSPTLTWSPIPGALSYRLQVSTRSDYATSIIDQGGITSTSYIANWLPANTTYYWRVNTLSGGVTGNWSNTWSFKTGNGFTVTPSSLAFQNIPMGSSKDLYVTMNNEGSDTVKVTNVVPLDTTYQPLQKFIYILPEQSAQLQIRFTPISSTLTSSYILIFHNLVGSPDTVAISGVGVRVPVLRLSSSFAQFNNTHVNSTKEISLTVSNSGKVPLQVSNIISSHAFFSIIPKSFSLSTDQSTNLKLLFSPLIDGATTVAFLILSDASTSPDTIKATGNGTPSLILANPLAIPTLADATPMYKRKLSNPPLFTGNEGVMTFTASSSNSVVTATVKEGDTLVVTRKSTGTASITVVAQDIDGSKKDYTTTVSVISEILTEKPTPTEYRLYSNYPNPFNPSTAIQYAIPKEQKIRLELYDMHGRKLCTLVNEEQKAGYYQVSFHGSGLPSGVYLYSLTAGEYRATKKMLLMK